MSAAAKSLADRKVRRQKIFIAVGSLVLVAVVGFQLTKVGGGGSETAASPTVAPAVGGAAAPGAPQTLPDTDRLVVVRNSDQLLSFGLFKSKDPFVQQLAPSTGAPGTASAAPAQPTATAPAATPSAPLGVGLTPTPPTATTPSDSPGAVVAPTGGQTPATTPGTTPPSATPTPAPVRTASIATNGVCQAVAVKGTFPTGEDIFRVVAIAPNGKSVDVAVVGGSYDSGQATATLKLGNKLTLVNTADGTRYVIALQSKCDPSQSVAPAPTTAPTSTTPVPPAPAATTTTTTTTTPIVTDPLDPPPFG